MAVVVVVVVVAAVEDIHLRAGFSSSHAQDNLNEGLPGCIC
jgi:hypothetical protein